MQFPGHRLRVEAQCGDDLPLAFMQNMMYQVVKISTNSPCLETVEIGRKLQFAAICALGLVFTENPFWRPASCPHTADACTPRKERHPQMDIGCVSFFCTQAGGGRIQEKDQERDESMKAKKNKRERSEQMRAP